MWGLLSLLAVRDRVVDPALLFLVLLDLLAASIRKLTTKLSKDASFGALEPWSSSRPPWLRRLAIVIRRHQRHEEFPELQTRNQLGARLVGTVRFGPP